MSKENPSIKKNLILSTFYQILTMIAPLITAPYVSRVIGSDGVGIYSYTNSLQLYFSMFAALGTVAYGSREIARVRTDKQQRSKLFWEIELLTIFTSTACIGIWLIMAILYKSYSIYLLILTANIFATMFDISWFYTGLEQFKYTVTQNSIFKILSIISIFIFVKDENDVAIYIAILAFSMLLGNMSMWMYLPKFLVKVNHKEFQYKKHFKETLIYFVPTIAISIYTVLDKTLIGLITHDDSENGYYEQATKIINMVKSLTFAALNSVFGARISYLYVEKKYEEIKEKIHFSMDYIMFMGIGTGTGVFAIAARFVPIFFGKGYEPVVPLLCTMTPLIVIIGISNCLGAQYYTPAGLRAKSARYLIYGSVINLIVNLLLIPKFGSMGAVVASVFAEAIITILYFVNCDGIINAKELIQIIWKKLISAAIMFIVIMQIDKYIEKDIIALLVEIAVGGTIFILCLLLLKDSFVNNIIQKIHSDREK